MKNENFSRSLTTSASVEKAYWAVTEGMHKWWTTPDRPMKQVGDRSKFTFPPGQSYWTFEATVLHPNERVEMICVDALHIHEGQPEEIQTEWLNTRVLWTMSSKGKESLITLEHEGLVPNLLCYDICKAGWDFFFLESLKGFLDSGIGQPHHNQS